MPANGQWKRCGVFERICLSLKLDASENCRKTDEFLEFEMDFCGFLKGLKNLEDAKDDEGWCMGGSFLGSESFEGFLVPPFFNR